MLPFMTPPVYPPIPPGRLAATIAKAGESTHEGCRLAILGLPDDTGVAMNHGRAGAREGPGAFRAALARYGVAEPGVGAMPRIFDAGDVQPGKTLSETHDRVTLAAERVIEAGMVPVGIGGGHDLTFALVRAACAKAGVIRGLYLDAHLDVREEPGSGMPMRALIERCGIKALINIGASPLVNTREHWNWFVSKRGAVASHAPNWNEDGYQPTGDVVGAPSFVSIDLDAIDAAHAPGVSAINPCGLRPATAARVAYFAGRSNEVRCFDIMELNPTHDRDHQTARLAAHLFVCFAHGAAERSR